MDAVLLGIAGAWVCSVALILTLMAVAQNTDDANDRMDFENDHIRFELAVPPSPRSIARGALPSSSQASRAPLSRFDVVAL